MTLNNSSSFQDFNFEQLKRYMEAYDLKSFNLSKFYEIFENERQKWGIKKANLFSEFVAHLVKNKILFHTIAIDPTGQDKTVFTYGKRDELTAMTAILKDGYYAYRTAMEINRLYTGKSPQLFLNAEHTKDRGTPVVENELTQDAITEAFQNKQRTNKNVWQWKGKELMLTNGKKTDRLGVISLNDGNSKYSYTDLERTLIDIVVRPVYAGGTRAVLKAFKKAKPTIELDVLEDYLQQLNYIYPYHQSIGYYLEKAGYPKKDYDRFNKPKVFDFYLAHGIDYTEYDAKWRLYVPDDL